MNRSLYVATLWIVAIGFSIAFIGVCIPPLLHDRDIVGAFAAGFVNPYSSGYALDALSCWLVLAAWVLYEAKNSGVRGGWVALLLGVAPGVAAGFAFYLLLRMKQQKA